MRYHQGKWQPKNPAKYVGDVNAIYFRSSWELRLLVWLDSNPSILKYASEELVIPYISPVDNRPHRYFVDFLVQYKTSGGDIKKAMIEVKPHAQTLMPEKKRKSDKKFLVEMQTYAVNQAKWAAARVWAAKNGWDFWVFDEYSLGIKKR